LATDSIQTGIPSQLLVNRPDIRQTELALAEAKLDVKVARANFYPSFKITAAAGFQAFNPTLLFNPKSLVYNMAGDLVAPMINRNAIIANYYITNAKQIQAVYNYEKTILNAHIDVLNELSRMNNFARSYEIKAKEVDILNQSVGISNSLFQSARADYMEVLLTQREALESKIELIEIKLKQMNAKVQIYRALGGGWN
jgi:outer membrane protein TolC